MEALIKVRSGWATPDGRHYEADDLRAALARVEALELERDGSIARMKAVLDVAKDRERAEQAERRLEAVRALCDDSDYLSGLAISNTDGGAFPESEMRVVEAVVAEIRRAATGEGEGGAK